MAQPFCWSTVLLIRGYHWCEAWPRLCAVLCMLQQRLAWPMRAQKELIRCTFYRDDGIMLQ